MPILGTFIVPHPPIILPEVGRGDEKKIQKTIDAYRETAKRIAKLNPETIVVTSPHATIYADYFHISPDKKARGDLKQFGVTGVSVEAQYDTEFVNALEQSAEEMTFPAGTLGERDKSIDHGTLIPLRFINEVFSGYKLVRIGLSGLSAVDHYRLGKYIANTAEKLRRRAVIVASGDLSHKLKEDGPYGFANEGPEFDRQITQVMAEGDFLRFLSFNPNFCDAAAECGLRSFIIMAGALDGKTVKPELLSYEGPFGVGYGVCSFEITGEDESRHFDEIYENEQRKLLDCIKEKEDAYVKLARLSLETYVKTGEKVKRPENLPGEMLKNKAGTFVSIKKYGQLRGCIGTIEPMTGCVADEILRNAICAATDDPRFSPVTRSELDDLVYSVDVLSEPEPIETIAELDVKRYGVIVMSGQKRGLLLPNLEGVDTPEQQLSIAMQKAGIRKGEKVSLERFEVVRHK